MARYNFITLLALSCVFTVCFARIPSFGLMTAGSVRSELLDEDFRIQFSKGINVTSPTWRLDIADLSKFPALAGIDVQSTIILVSVKRGEPFFSHYHPRANEVFIALKGSFRISFRFEGLGNVRNVSNVISQGEVSVFPQGLIHDIMCTGKKDCLFYAVLDSADPGIVPV